MGQLSCLLEAKDSPAKCRIPLGIVEGLWDQAGGG